METLIYGSMDIIDMCEKTDFIIRQRIQQYKDDISAVYDHNIEHPDMPLEKDRIRQDQVIINELESILYGKGLEVLHYVS